MHRGTYDSQDLWSLIVLDKWVYDGLVISGRQRLSVINVIKVRTGLNMPRGVPASFGSHNGPEFVAEAVHQRITTVGSSAPNQGLAH